MMQITIWQQNTNRSLVAQSDFLHQLDPTKYDIGAIQEPYLDHLHNSQATHHWFTIFLKEHYTNPSKTRSLMLINRQITTDAWSQVDMGLSDVTAIQLTTGHGKIIIANIYNEGEHQQGLRATVQASRDRAQTAPTPGRAMPIIWVSDFNLHHPLWDEVWNTHLFMRANLNKAQYLIDAAADLDLQMALPTGIPSLCAM